MGYVVSLLLMAVVFVLFYEFTQGDVHPIIYILAIGPSLGAAVLMVCRVCVTEDRITIKYLIPLRKSRDHMHEDIEFYAPIKGRNQTGKAFMGMLKFRREKNSFILWGGGIKDFERLSVILEEIYPKPSTQQVSNDNAEKPPGIERGS